MEKRDSILSRDFPNSSYFAAIVRGGVKNFSLVLERLGHANRPAIVRSIEKFVIEPVPSGGVARYADDDDGGGNGLPPFQLSLVLHSLMKNSLVDSATGSRLSMPRSFT